MNPKHFVFPVQSAQRSFFHNDSASSCCPINSPHFRVSQSPPLTCTPLKIALSTVICYYSINYLRKSDRVVLHLFAMVSMCLLVPSVSLASFYDDTRSSVSSFENNMDSFFDEMESDAEVEELNQDISELEKFLADQEKQIENATRRLEDLKQANETVAGRINTINQILVDISSFTEAANTLVQSCHSLARTRDNFIAYFAAQSPLILNFSGYTQIDQERNRILEFSANIRANFSTSQLNRSVTEEIDRLTALSASIGGELVKVEEAGQKSCCADDVDATLRDDIEDMKTEFESLSAVVLDGARKILESAREAECFASQFEVIALDILHDLTLLSTSTKNKRLPQEVELRLEAVDLSNKLIWTSRFISETTQNFVYRSLCPKIALQKYRAAFLCLRQIRKIASSASNPHFNSEDVLSMLDEQRASLNDCYEALRDDFSSVVRHYSRRRQGLLESCNRSGGG